MRDERPQVQQGPRSNQKIRVPEVRLIGADGEQVGILPTYEALKLAQDEGLDLVEVSPQARPPVCRLMDLGKYKYLQKKKEAESRRNTAEVSLKEVKIGYKTDPHDLATFTNRAFEWLTQGSKVKITLVLRGREMAHSALGREKVEAMVESLSGVSKPEAPIRQEGKAIVVFLVKK